MARKSEKIYVHFDNVNRNRSRRLRSVHKEWDAALTAYFTDFLNRIQRARDVRAVSHGDKAGFRPYGLAYAVEADALDRVCFDLCNAYARVLKIGQGTSYGIVLHLACDHVIAGLKHALKSQIYCVRRVEREDYARRIRYVKQRCESSSGIVYAGSSSAGLLGIGTSRITAAPY